MNSRRSLPIFAVLLVIAAIAVTGYFMSKDQGTTGVPDTASNTPSGAATTTSSVPVTTPSAGAAIPFPASTTPDLSVWKRYSSAAQGYSLSYPIDLVRSTEADGSITLTFPKNVYFHWPLQDDAKITISVGTSCPAITAAGLGGDATPASFELDGRTWKRTVGFDVAAGNRYEEIAYDTVKGSTCYHLGFLDHGANGAGLYVDDASLIKKYDATHDTDLATVILILNTMVGSFKN